MTTLDVIMAVITLLAIIFALNAKRNLSEAEATIKTIWQEKIRASTSFSFSLQGKIIHRNRRFWLTQESGIEIPLNNRLMPDVLDELTTHKVTVDKNGSFKREL